MSTYRKGLTTLLIAGISIGSYLIGSSLVRDVRFAQAQEQVQASREQLKNVDDLASVYRAVGKAVEPSVVKIVVRKTVKNVRASMPFDDEMLRRFFPDRNGDGQPDLPRGMRPNSPNSPDNGGDTMEQVAEGSGVIMEAGSGTGYILTNNHVAGAAESMEITLSDGREIKKAKTVGTDPKSDLAVVRIEADRLIPAKWGDSDQLEKGDIIFAFGSPFGYVGSMTHGIVSALNRQQVGILQSKFSYENFIQVDAPINPGNSGGPLVNLHGEVVGINTAIATETGAFNGIGFAIPSNQAKAVYSQLKDNGKVVRGFIGTGIRDVAKFPKLAESIGYNGDSGVWVDQVYPNTPATGKLKEGDVITAINGKKVVDSNQLRGTVASTPPGEELTFTVVRDEKNQDVKVKIGEQPDELASLQKSGPDSGKSDNGNGNSASAAPGTAARTLGLRLATPTDEMISRFGLDEGTKGAIVTAVAPRSPADRAGVQPGDVITQVGKQNVNSSQEAMDALAKQDLSKGIRLYVKTGQGNHFVLLEQEEQ